MDGSDFQTLGAASILSKKVSQWKGDSEDKWDGYHIFEEAKKGDMICNRAIDQMAEILGKGIANICDQSRDCCAWWWHHGPGRVSAR